MCFGGCGDANVSITVFVRRLLSPSLTCIIEAAVTRDVVLGTRTRTRVQLEYKFLVLVLVLVLIDKVLVLVLVRTVLVLVTTVHAPCIAEI